MSTSGVVTLTVTAQEIFQDALYLIGALEEGEAITGDHTTACKRAFNMMAKSWQAQGVHVWTKTEGILFLNPNQKSYTLPTANCAKDSFGYTLLDGAHSSSDTTLDVVSTAPSNMTALANGDYVGIELADGTRYWTTVNGAPSATGITLTTGLSGDASDGATIFWYTTQITRPSRLLDARRGQYDQAEVPVELVARDIYTEQPSKLAASIPTMVHYSPQLTTGTLYVWPVSSSCRNVLPFTYERPLEIISAVTDEADFPSEWLETLVWNLAWRLGPQYGEVAQAKAQALKPDALAMLAEMLDFDNDDNALYLQA